MITYIDLKKKVLDHKIKILTAVCFVLVFFVGFGTGRYAGPLHEQKSQSNYTTKSFQTKTVATPTGVKNAQNMPATSQSTTTASCLIKGNISSSGKKIYHVPTGALYKVVHPEQCLTTEAEAQAAGFVKSGR